MILRTYSRTGLSPVDFRVIQGFRIGSKRASQSERIRAESVWEIWENWMKTRSFDKSGLRIVRLPSLMLTVFALGLAASSPLPRSGRCPPSGQYFLAGERRGAAGRQRQRDVAGRRPRGPCGQARRRPRRARQRLARCRSDTTKCAKARHGLPSACSHHSQFRPRGLRRSR